MKIERNSLEEKILYVIEEIIHNKNYNDKILDNIQKSLFNRGILEAGRILNKNIPLETLSDQVLYLLTKYLYEETQMETINPTRYFTDIEISMYNKFKRNLKTKDEPIVFKNLIQVMDDQWHGVMHIKDIAELYNRGRITYNPETQRESIFKEVHGQIIVRPKINKQSRKEITKALKQGTYIPDEITFNVRKTGKENFKFTKGNWGVGDLIVYEGYIDVIDGYHRSLAILDVLSEMPSLDRVMEVRITNFTIEKAQRFIVQKNKQNKIAERKIKSMDVQNYANSIVKRLNEDSQSDLRGKIATDSTAILKGLAIVGFEYLSESIEYFFNIKTRRDANKIGDYLIEFFNEIYGIYYDEFENYKGKNIKTNQFTFIGYVALASKLYNQSNWKQKLEDVLKEANFDEIKELIPINNYRIRKGIIKKIGNYFHTLA